MPRRTPDAIRSDRALAATAEHRAAVAALDTPATDAAGASAAPAANTIAIHALVGEAQVAVESAIVQATADVQAEVEAAIARLANAAGAPAAGMTEKKTGNRSCLLCGHCSC